MPGPIDPARPLRVLFVGSMGQRKGLADLFSAMELLKGENIELVVMGSPLADMSFYRGQYADFTHEKGRPHAEVLELMRSCDVFCLPSLFEGRALVMQEAMSQGLPLVITPNTGGEDLIVEGETGFLVPIRAPEQIADKLAWFNHHRQELLAMKHMAIRHAASYTWQGYAEVVIQAILRL
jgi:glycosyltransferase involved in cell wall biosynthesis